MEFNIKKMAFKQFTPEQIAESRKNMVDECLTWFADKYPNAKLEVLERNLAVILEIKKYDDTCISCFSTDQCPSKDGNRMNGRLMADGIVSIWFEPCPKGHRLVRIREEKETKVKSDWRSMA